MADYSFKLFVKSGSANLNFKVNEEPIIIGSAPACHIFLESDGPEIKAIIQRDDECLSIKIYDLKFPVEIVGKKFKSAKIKKSAAFKIGKFDFVFKKEAIEALPSLPEFDAAIEEILPDFEETDTEINIQNLKAPTDDFLKKNTVENSTRKETHNSVNTSHLSNGHNETNHIQRPAVFYESMEFEDAGINFNTSFSERTIGLNEYLAYSNPLMDFSDYIDLEDESITSVPIPEIHVDQKSESYHVLHINNGTVLFENFFPVTRDRIFLSNRKSNKNHFLVHDAPTSKDDFIHTVNGQKQVLVPQGYSAVKYIKQSLTEVSSKSVPLNKGEKVVLTLGTSQIVIECTNTPSKIKTNPVVNVEDKMIKAIAFSWAFAIFFITTVLVVDVKKQETNKKDMVVLFKRKKVDSVEKKPSTPSSSVAKNDIEIEKPKIDSPVEEIKKTEPAKSQSKESKAIAEVQPPKKSIKKEVVKKKRVSKKVSASHINARTAPAVKKPLPAPKKKFDFGFGSKMQQLAKNTNAKSMKNLNTAGSNIADSMNSKSSLKSNFNQSSIGKTNSKVSRFVSGVKIGSNGALGTKGLSGKTNTTTSYIQSSTKILGAMDPELIRKIMREYIPQFRHCYQRELVVNPSVAGVFDLEFQINSRGQGIKVGVKKQGKNFSRKGMNCLKKVVSMIPFPKPKGGGLVDVKQPMNFYQQ